MLTLPSVDETNGQLSHQVLPVDSSQTFNSSQTGLVMLVDTSSAPVLINMPLTSEVSNYSIYFVLVSGANDLEIYGQGDDTIDSTDGIETNTQWSMVLLTATSGDWEVTKEAGTWNSLTTTTV